MINLLPGTLKSRVADGNTAFDFILSGSVIVVFFVC